MRRLLAFVLHATAATIMAWGWFTLNEGQEWLKTQKGGHYQYLTIQGLALAWLCMVVSLLCGLSPSVHVVRVKRALLMLALPLEFVITTIYWSLIFASPKLIAHPLGGSEPMSGNMSQLMHLPLTTDLALHVSPLSALLIDFFGFECKFTQAQVDKVAPVTVVVFAIWYASLVEYCATFNGAFPYPFLTYSPFAVRVLIYTTTVGLALGCFRSLNALHS